MTITTKTHHCRERLKQQQLKQQVESTDRREVTTIKEHNIINSERERANKNVTEVSRPPIEMLQKTAGLQKTENLRSLIIAEKCKQASLVKRLNQLKKRFPKLHNEHEDMSQQIREVKKKLGEASKNLVTRGRLLEIAIRRLEDVLAK